VERSGGVAPEGAVDARGLGRVRYEPALDGLRALAVSAVLLYHEHGPASTKLGRGGFLGVDLFFALSGYLITSLLLAERRSTGRIALGSFWRRRARRLLPALLLTIGLAAAYARFWATASERWQIKQAIVPALFYFQNWHVMSHPASVLSPTWSLAIEEQWYLVWPVVLGLALVVWRRPTRMMCFAVGGAAIAVAVWTAHVFAPLDDHAYYSSDTRVLALLVGATLAIGLTLIDRPLGAVATHAIDVAAYIALGLVLWAFATWTTGSSALYHGGLLLFAVAAATLLVAATQPESRVRRALAWRPLVALGVISYGVYLYSVPLITILDPSRTHLSGRPLFLVRIVVILFVAYVSWRFIEQPIRRAPPDRAWPWVVIAGGVALALFAAVSLTASAPKSSSLLTEYLDQYNQLGRDAPSGSTRLLVVGGDEAATLNNAARPYKDLPTYGVAASMVNCGVTSALARGSDAGHRQPCKFSVGLLAGVAREYKPQVLAITIEAADVQDRTVHGRRVKVGSSDWRNDALAQLDAFRKQLPGDVKHVVLIAGCGPTGSTPDAATARADAVWRDYAHAHSDAVSVAIPPATACADHRGGLAMWQWLSHGTNAGAVSPA
jgi:peptidoglycan/LPS O-acetylase OafA/YrhL